MGHPRGSTAEGQGWLASYRADHADRWNAAIHHLAQPLLVFWALGLADRAGLAGPLWIGAVVGWMLLDRRAGLLAGAFGLLAWGVVGLVPPQVVGVAGLLGWSSELVGHGLVERAWPRPLHALAYVGVGPVNTAATALERLGWGTPP